MALVKQYTDSAGNACPASYWRVVTLSIAARAGRIDLEFRGWRDAAAFQAGLQPLAGAARSYQIEGPDFLAVAGAPPVGATLYDVLADATEAYALARLDTPTGAAGPDGKPQFRSFFEGARQV